MLDPRTEFRAAIASAGLTPPDAIEADGKLRRFASNGKRSDDSGWYVFHDDGIPAGAYGDWRTGVSETWRADVGRPLTEEERRRLAAKAEADRKAREEEEARRHAEARAEAERTWQSAAPASGDHRYLADKVVQAHRIRVNDRGQLVIPMRDAGGTLHSLQFISGSGEKLFLPGGRVTGCYFGIGRPNGVLCIAEGYATGASVHEATGHAVAVAFNTGNLKAVGQALRIKYPETRLVFCADDDAETAGNPGLTKAREAALAVGGLVAVPDFGADRPTSATDFSDLVRFAGAEAARRAVDAAAAPAEAQHQLTKESASAADLWPDPMPIPVGLPAVKKFDYALLPNSLRPWIEDIAERVQCPPDFPAVGAMVSMSAVVGRKVGIRPKRRDDWLEVPNLWGAIVGRSGVMKSPAQREAMRPLRKLDAEAAKAFEAEAQQWQRDRELTKLRREAERANLLKELKKGKDVATNALNGDALDDEPQARRYIVNDTSVEALGEILRHNQNGVLAYRDELIGLLKSLDKEGQEGARGFYLSAWSGLDGYTFDRIGRGLNLRIDACCLSLLGSIQPSVIGGYLREAVAHGGADGLLSRFQLLVWPDIAGEWRDVDRFPDSDAKAAAYAMFDKLDTLDPVQAGAAVDDGTIPYLRFDDAAQELFSEWRSDFEPRLRSGSDHAALESHLAKYRKLVPALALLTHLAENQATGAVGETDLLKALAWAEYLESHARRAYASVTQSESEGARALLSRIRRGEVPDPFTPRDVYLKHWAYLATPEATHEAVRLLGDLDYLRMIEHRPGTSGGRPKVEYQINPKARQA